MRDLSKGLPPDYTEEEFRAYAMASYLREQAAKFVSRRLVLGILEQMAAESDAKPTPQSAEAFGIRKGVRMALGTAMDRIKAMPGADETLHREEPARGVGEMPRG